MEPAGKARLEPLRRFAASEARGRVLEIGAGVGSNLPYYRWDQVESLDLAEPDPYMVRRMQPKLDRLAPEARQRVRLHTAPAEALPFDDDSFDCVVVTLVLCSVQDTEASLAELRRVLRPGGELRVVEHVRAGIGWSSVQRMVQPVYGYFSGGCNLSRETEAALRRAGFEVQVQERLSLGGPWLPAFTAVALNPATAPRRVMPARQLHRRRLLRRGVYLLDRRFLRRPHRYAFQALLAALTLGAVVAASDALTNAAIVTAIASTAFILFMAPHSKLARPRRVLGGHFIGVLIGLTANLFIAEVAGGPLASTLARDITAAAAVGFSMLVMAATDTEHPPAAGTVLGLVLADDGLVVAALVLTAATALSLAHRLFRRWLIDLTG